MGKKMWWKTSLIRKEKGNLTIDKEMKRQSDRFVCPTDKECVLVLTLGGLL